ncbi:unnamed protein product [Polarella glacialis]|uniref:Plastid lipid-associated protein/fibrillin conserved domain-containing protein n=1 Tax=Polarella glacialis TaxID=89957 RepID=A0A813KYE6_POLGL|nr:unnamed protein product [Polarella glacialis]
MASRRRDRFPQHRLLQSVLLERGLRASLLCALCLAATAGPAWTTACGSAGGQLASFLALPGGRSAAAAGPGQALGLPRAGGSRPQTWTACGSAGGQLASILTQTGVSAEPQTVNLLVVVAVILAGTTAAVAGQLFASASDTRLTEGRRAVLKRELLALTRDSQRGADLSKSEAIKEVFSKLETLTPTREPLKSPLLKGDWELLWTTSDSILDKPILQFLDPEAGFARNLESTPLGDNTVEASIAPLDPEQREAFVSRLDDFLLFKQGAQEKKGGTYMPDVADLERTTVGVRFKTFRLLGLLSVGAPEKATGILQVTYLDEDLRLSRGDRGNLFVLRKVGLRKVGLL